ncbi:MAG: translation initiation factor IF-2 [Candidatus Absconditabacteria bacterium]|nr:translation initiation factor IF-2 [Candidatus Absconditabacteria bacterium]MDD3868695.1 translation initiation factor IF-2 [Candidatus Absconditabacteria bacterium]MDD4714385.1 translation initiation factor IF-2 [Candidatus Absconditabacteria bacterium]
MPSISDAIKSLSVDQDIFAQLYEKVVGKSLPKTGIVSDANLEKMKKLADKLPKDITTKSKKENIVEKSEEKILKSDEISFGGGGFLSGLGFAKQEEKEQKVDLDEFFGKHEEPTSSTVDIFSFTSHTPSTTTERAPRSDASRRDSRSSGAGRGTGERPQRKSGGNVNISQGSYTPKDKSTVTASDFFDTARKANQQSGTKGKQPYSPHYKNDRNERQVHHLDKVKRVEKEATTSANLVKKGEIFMDEKISVKEFSEKMGVPVIEVMKKLMENKIMTGINSSLDFDTATLIAADFGVEVKKNEVQLDMESFMSGDLQKILDLDKEASVLVERAPVVTVMGHVDHGKTSLLDYLRHTGVAEGEAGGITQSIGASVVEHSGKKITFIDTPGHELFTSLRARGAKLTNIAIIVVAADDSVMPQTIESINHAKASGVPVIIAITKIDKPGKNLEQIKSDIAAQGLTPEEWGGETPIIGISSKTGEGIDLLLEQVLLQAEMLELKYNPNRAAVGVVVDSYKDPKQGVVASVIVLTGTLQMGNIVLAYNTYGKIKRMQNWKGQAVQKVVGGEPVQVLGFPELPEAGRIVEVVNNEKEAYNKVSLIQAQESSKSAGGAVQEFLSQLKSANATNKISELRLILKAEGASSLEALQQAVQGLSLPKNVIIKTVHSDVGHFTESDVSLAQVSKSLLIGFNVSINSTLKKKAEQQKVEIKSFDIIYELTDYLSNLLLGMIEIEQEEVTVGKMEVLGIFFTETREMTIGGMVIEGKVKNKLKFRIHRGEEIIGNGEILSLQRNKNQVKEVLAGEDCGMKVKMGKKILEKDVLEFWEMQDIVEHGKEKQKEE